MSYYRYPITGLTDASGNAAIQIGPLSGAQFFLGFVTAQVRNAGTGLYELQDLAGAPIASSISRPAVLGPLYLAPGDQAILAVSAAPVNSPIQGYLTGDRNPDPAQLALPTAPASAAIPPVTWSILSGRVDGGTASVSIAGVPGVRHIATSLSYNFSSKAAIGALDFNVVIRDGASGTGAVIFEHSYSLPAGSIPPFAFGLTGGAALLTGTPGNAMTIEFSAGIANFIESVDLSGYDQ